MHIEGSKVVNFIYDTEYQQFSGESWREAEEKLMAWVRENTGYRRFTSYAKHHGFRSIYETMNGKRYVMNGNDWYEIDQYYNITRISSSDVNLDWFD